MQYPFYKRNEYTHVYFKDESTCLVVENYDIIVNAAIRKERTSTWLLIMKDSEPCTRKEFGNAMIEVTKLIDNLLRNDDTLDVTILADLHEDMVVKSYQHSHY